MDVRFFPSVTVFILVHPLNADFPIRTTVDGKLAFKHVKGGVNLVEEEFTLKADKKLINAIKNI